MFCALVAAIKNPLATNYLGTESLRPGPHPTNRNDERSDQTSRCQMSGQCKKACNVESSFAPLSFRISRWLLPRTTRRLRAAASEARSVASTAPNMISRYSFPARLRNKDPIARKPPRFPPLSRYQPLRNPVFLRWADRWRSPDGVLQQLLCRNPKRRLRRRKSSTSHPGRTTATTSASWRISTSRSTSTIWCAHGHTSTPHACTCICVCTVECTTGKSVTLLPSVGICLYSWREGGMPISTCTTWRFVLLPRTQTVVRGALTHKHMDRRMVGRMSYGPQIDTLADTCQQAGV